MTADGHYITYAREGDRGILTLSGDPGTLSAVDLHEAALRALQDNGARTVCVCLSGVDRLDLSSLQVLLALRGSLRVEHRRFEVADFSGALRQQMEYVGIALDQAA